MAAQPKLTTVLVNYNHSRFLPESLGSILAQTRPPDELIVIDDTSTDNSVEIIEALIPRHPNARLIKNKVNQGCFANVNDGVRLAAGDFVHLAAADDIFYPRLYDVGMSLLQVHGGGVFTSRSAIVDEHGRRVAPASPWAGYPMTASGYLSPAQSKAVLMREDGWFMGNTALFRTASVRAYGGFPVEMLSFADGYMCRYLALKEGACFSSEILGAWRRMDSGFASSVSDSPERFRSIIAAAERHMLKAPGVFSTDYIERWKGRQEFELQRRALARWRASLPASGALAGAVAGVKEKVLAALLLLKLRPWDVVANIRQRIALYRGRI